MRSLVSRLAPWMLLLPVIATPANARANTKAAPEPAQVSPPPPAPVVAPPPPAEDGASSEPSYKSQKKRPRDPAPAKVSAEFDAVLIEMGKLCPADQGVTVLVGVKNKCTEAKVPGFGALVVKRFRLLQKDPRPRDMLVTALAHLEGSDPAFGHALEFAGVANMKARGFEGPFEGIAWKTFLTSAAKAKALNRDDDVGKSIRKVFAAALADQKESVAMAWLNAKTNSPAVADLKMKYLDYSLRNARAFALEEWKNYLAANDTVAPEVIDTLRFAIETGYQKVDAREDAVEEKVPAGEATAEELCDLELAMLPRAPSKVVREIYAADTDCSYRDVFQISRAKFVEKTKGFAATSDAPLIAKYLKFCSELSDPMSPLCKDVPAKMRAIAGETLNSAAVRVAALNELAKRKDKSAAALTLYKQLENDPEEEVEEAAKLAQKAATGAVKKSAQ